MSTTMHKTEQRTAEEFRATPQIAPDVYDYRYLHKGRIANYAKQLTEIVRVEAKSVLEVGLGGGFMRNVARDYLQTKWFCCDIDPALGPDTVGTVTQLPIASNGVDVSVCCQVLEHLPFDCFEPSLRELSRVARQYVMISLPDIRRYYSLAFCLPKIGWFRRELNIERPGKRVLPFNGEHYWEIGYTGSRWRQVKKAIFSAGLRFVRCARLQDYSYHNFMVLSRA